MEFDIACIYEHLSSFISPVIPITIGEVVVDKFPLFPINPHQSVLNDSKGYVNRFSSFYNEADGAESFFKFLIYSRNDALILKQNKKFKDGGSISTWAHYVITDDLISTPGWMNIFLSLKQYMNLSIFTTENILYSMEDVRYCDHLYEKISSSEIVTLPKDYFLQSNFFDVLYADCSEYFMHPSSFSERKTPTIILSKPNVYDELNWQWIDCGGLGIYHNLGELHDKLKEFNTQVGGVHE